MEMQNPSKVPIESSTLSTNSINRLVAQSVEQRTHNAKVKSSKLFEATIFFCGEMVITADC